MNWNIYEYIQKLYEENKVWLKQSWEMLIYFRQNYWIKDKYYLDIKGVYDEAYNDKVILEKYIEKIKHEDYMDSLFMENQKQFDNFYKEYEERAKRINETTKYILDKLDLNNNK